MGKKDNSSSSGRNKLSVDQYRQRLGEFPSKLLQLISLIKAQEKSMNCVDDTGLGN